MYRFLILFFCLLISLFLLLSLLLFSYLHCFYYSFSDLLSWLSLCFISFFIVKAAKVCLYFLNRVLIYLISLSSSVFIFMVYKIISLYYKNLCLCMYLVMCFVISRYKAIFEFQSLISSVTALQCFSVYEVCS